MPRDAAAPMEGCLPLSRDDSTVTDSLDILIEHTRILSAIQWQFSCEIENHLAVGSHSAVDLYQTCIEMSF